ncbi:hypothetical protein [Desulfomonile tiedjei]|uniref:Uncharacterized protein n=1 Tax=Desulfomonile tiedjei (strain ATCC 49306 / DSM 6799 / DCB-1) TaxID=706587 RepID=I4C1M0_DESTA|nr:hypothetical protein [Desulfomonile tiedjei]AFM23461.1 hypothetical protein Desti_0735 [Desulfomonile tiedjei DSM 6799]
MKIKRTAGSRHRSLARCSRQFLSNLFGWYLVGMFVKLRAVSRMSVVVRTMISRMIMAVRHLFPTMLVRMFVLMAVFVSVCVRVLVNMHSISVAMLMSVGVAVLVRMQMLVFVIAFHVYGLLSMILGLVAQYSLVIG